MASFENNEKDVINILREQKKLIDEKKSKDALDPKKKMKGKSNANSRSKKAGLMFPVGTIDRKLKDMDIAKRVGAGAPVFLAAVLEYLTAEVLELAGDHAKDDPKAGGKKSDEKKKTRILPRHIATAIHKDEELSKYMGKTTIAQGGYNPNLPNIALPQHRPQGH